MAKKQFTSDYDAEFAEADELEELEDQELQEMGDGESRGKNPGEIESDETEEGDFKEAAPEAEEL